MSKEQAFKMIEGRIETIQRLSIECIEYIYSAGWNEAIETAANDLKKSYPDHTAINAYCAAVRSLKNECARITICYRK